MAPEPSIAPEARASVHSPSLSGGVLPGPVVAAFVVCAGVLATFRLPYLYGLINQIEHLPTILHLIDASVLADDWHVQQSLAFGPRYYYYLVIAALGQVFPLPALMLVATLLSNIFILWVAFHTARILFRDDRAALAGCALIAAVHSIDLGGATFLTWRYFIQASLAQPLALLALLAGLRLRPLAATLLGASAALVHPVVGLETGAIALGVVGLAALRGLSTGRQQQARREAIRLGLYAAAGLGALVFLAYGLYLGRMEEALSDEAFFRILVYFRNPHHYVPSQMGSAHWLRFVLFLASAGLSWWWWRRAPETSRRLAQGVMDVFGMVLLLLAAGYVFVEVVPVRLVASAQLYRMVYLIKWLGLLLVGRTLVVWLRGGGLDRWTALLALAGTGMAQPLTLALAHGVAALRRWLPLPRVGQVLLLVLATGGVVGLVLLQFERDALLLSNIQLHEYEPLREYVFLVLLFGLAAWCWLGPRSALRWAAPLALVGAGLVLLLALPPRHALREKAGVFTLAEGEEPFRGVADYARAHLAKEALVVTPPMGGRFRLLAERPIIVDFKAFVFQDSSVAQWMDRMTTTYGEASQGGFAGAGELGQRYREIDDGRLADVARHYGARYAVLHRETPTAYPVLYEDEAYKLVEVVPPAAASASLRAPPRAPPDGG